MNDLTYIPSWMKVLPLLEKHSIRKTKSLTGIADSHAYTIVKEFERKGWIIRHKEGRGYVITLTDAGINVSKKCKAMMSVIENVS